VSASIATNDDPHAESFLCFAPTSPMAREVKPVAAFSWGFVLNEGHLTLRSPASLALSAWTQHVPMLAAAYPAWTYIAASPP
jgi:hypothetical protein